MLWYSEKTKYFEHNILFLALFIRNTQRNHTEYVKKFYISFSAIFPNTNIVYRGTFKIVLNTKLLSIWIFFFLLAKLNQKHCHVWGVFLAHFIRNTQRNQTEYVKKLNFSFTAIFPNSKIVCSSIYECFFLICLNYYWKYHDKPLSFPKYLNLRRPRGQNL